MPKDVSVEYAHIYTNQHVSEEHKVSLDVLSQLKELLKEENATSSLVVMIDDYSFPDPTFDYNEFYKWLDSNGHHPDLAIRESQLMPVCDQVLRQIENAKIKTPIVDYIKAKKYPCSLFIASWYLLRLGKVKSDIFPENLTANKIINILPESFKPFEDKALEIIASTPHHESVHRIEYRFLPGRLLA